MKRICNLENRVSFKGSHSFCFILAQFLILGLSLEADVKLPEGLGTVATPISANVNRGEELVIKLTASMKGSAGVFDFSIFEKPKNGRLVLESLTGAFALVRYVSDPLSLSGMEQFKYRARVRNGKYSAPATVRINVLNDPLRLKIPKALDFGEVVVSQSRALDFQILNASKYEFQGSLVLPNEFTLVGNEVNINLGPEQSSTFRVKYTPRRVVGSFQRNLIINGDGVSLSLPLRGVSISPIKIKNKKIILKYSDDKFSRSAELSIKNVSDVETNLEIIDAKGAFVVSPKKMIIGPGKVAKIIIEASNENPSSSKGFVHLRSEVDSQKIEVESPPLPPRVVLNGGERLIKISSIEGVPLRFKFSIENVGGGSVSVALTVPEGFRRLNGDGLINLGPRSKSLMQFEYDSKRSGNIYDYFGLSWNDNVKRIIVKGHVSENPKIEINAKPRVAPSSTAENERVRLNLYDHPLFKRIEKEREVDDSLPQIREVKLIERGKRSLVLGWSYPSQDDRSSANSDLSYVIETRVHRYDEDLKSLIFEWRELGPDYATIQKKDSSVEAKINGLSPDGKYIFRIFCESNDGLFSVESVPFRFQTKPSLKLSKAKWMYLMGGGSVLLCLCCILIQRKMNFNG